VTALFLADASAILPEGLEFLQFGWWVIHIVSIVLVYVYGYRKGRKDERRASKIADKRPDQGS
jgi:hypothetical protein